jgi:hypothetical protein
MHQFAQTAWRSSNLGGQWTYWGITHHKDRASREECPDVSWLEDVHSGFGCWRVCEDCYSLLQDLGWGWWNGLSGRAYIASVRPGVQKKKEKKKIWGGSHSRLLLKFECILWSSCGSNLVPSAAVLRGGTFKRWPGHVALLLPMDLMLLSWKWVSYDGNRLVMIRVG